VGFSGGQKAQHTPNLPVRTPTTVHRFARRWFPMAVRQRR
jgi:hypothetical protein